MKQNKKTLIILVPAVLFIWGLIAFRIFKAIEQPDLSMPQARVTPVVEIQEDTTKYTLSLNYQSPFRESVSQSKYNKKREPKNPKQETKVKHTVTKAPIRWPRLNYQGLISREGSALCLVEIDAQLFFMAKGEEQKGVKLLAVTNDSIGLQFENERKYIRK